MTDQDTMPAVDLEGLERLRNAALIDQPCAFATGAAYTAWAEASFEAQPAILTLAKRALSATPLSQAPAGEGVGVEERVARGQIADIIQSDLMFYRVNRADAETVADHIAMLAAQPTQDDAKRLREALNKVVIFQVEGVEEWLYVSINGVRMSFPAESVEASKLLRFEAERQALTPTSKTGDTDHAPEQ